MKNKNKNIGETSEHDEILNKTYDAQDIRLRDRIIDSILKPSFMAVAITALFGPCTVQNAINDIELKKLQAKVMTDVLTLTNSSDFKTTSGVLKAGLFAKMVNENEPLFHLNFREASLKFDEIEKNYKHLGIINLEEENAQKTKTISELEKNKQKSDENIHALKRELEQLDTNSKKDANARKLIEEKIRIAEQTKDQYAQQVAELEKDKRENNKLIEAKNKQVEELFEKNKAKQKDIDELAKNISNSKNLANDLKAALSEKDLKIKEATDAAEIFKNQLSEANTELKKVKDQLYDIEKKAEKAEDELKLKQETIENLKKQIAEFTLNEKLHKKTESIEPPATGT
ncbi:MAG: hypothetical protein OEY64_05145 [Nitrospinota bacterium]|nr:hypothetical protein [Nitrospinota bacterium]